MQPDYEIHHELTRYCVVYELLEMQANPQAVPLTAISQKWLKLDQTETFTLEKIFYILLQLIVIAGELEKLNIFNYLDL